MENSGLSERELLHLYWCCSAGRALHRQFLMFDGWEKGLDDAAKQQAIINNQRFLEGMSIIAKASKVDLSQRDIEDM